MKKMKSSIEYDKTKTMRRLIVLYNILSFIVFVIGFPLIVPAILLCEKRRKTVFQRLGLASIPAVIRQNKKHLGAQKPIWIHALSVGEVLSAAPLIKKIKDRFKSRPVLVSVSTRTGFQIANKQYEKTADAIFYYPYDLAFAVQYIAGKVAPALVVIVESDIWPNFLFEMQQRNIPVILANARLSDRSFQGYKRVGFFSKRLFSFFTLICTQSRKDAERFLALGVPANRITVAGNIKFEQDDNLLPEEEIKKLRQQLQIRQLQKILLAGSTHKGEEEILVRVFTKMKTEIKGLLLVVAPRDPERAGSVQRLFQSAGNSAVLMKALDRLEPAVRYDVLIVDTIGVLKNLYAIADVAFVGGSLVPCGGHNPLEPAVFSKPVIFGPDMSDFSEIASMLVAANGAERVQDAEGLYCAASTLFRDDQKAKKMGQRAFKVFSDNKGAVDKTLKVIEDFL